MNLMFHQFTANDNLSSIRTPQAACVHDNNSITVIQSGKHLYQGRALNDSVIVISILNGSTDACIGE